MSSTRTCECSVFPLLVTSVKHPSASIFVNGLLLIHSYTYGLDGGCSCQWLVLCLCLAMLS